MFRLDLKFRLTHLIIQHILTTVCVTALLKSTLSLFYPMNKKTNPNLPPGPHLVTVLGSFLWLRKSFSDIEPLLRNFHAKYGPIVTLKIGSRPAIFISDRSIAYQALVQNGSVFSDRPSPLPTVKLFTSNQHNISSAGYGPNWRLFRRNLTAEILHPSRVKLYGAARKWALQILISKLELSSKSSDSAPVRVVDHFQYAMFCLLVFMCFGDKVDENQIRAIENVQRDLLLNWGKFNILNFWPSIGKIVFKKRWELLYGIRRNQENVLIPLIRSRQQFFSSKKRSLQLLRGGDDKLEVLSYVDTLLDLQLPEDGNRKFNDAEMVSLCSEFLNAGTDTTTTALQWIMANVVKYPEIQNKIVEEIKGVVKPEAREVEEEDLHKLPYLKAVILEGLRRHPPGHFVLPHTVSQDDVTLNGFAIPKSSSLNIMVAEMGWDPNVWEDPMVFKPERFNENGNGGEVFYMTCSKEIKMMPFGAGRRMCPAFGLAMLHLEYFVANLVWHFKWGRVEGDDVDLSEKQELTIVMKNPLQVHLSTRA